MRLSLMSSNIWGDYFGNEVSHRDEQLAMIYRRYRPDILGLQEMNSSWWASPVWETLEDAYCFVPADTQNKMNYVPLMYNRTRFELLDMGWRLYHENLDPSKGYTSGVFRDRENRRVFAVFNTHFWWEPKIVDDYVRCYNAMVLDKAMKATGEKFQCPVFFMGDLNCAYDSCAWEFLKSAGWVSSFAIAREYSDFSSLHGDPQRGADHFYHGKTTGKPKESSIDHIGMSPDSTVEKQLLITDQEALDATDHSPVFVHVIL